MANDPRKDRDTETRDAVKHWQPASVLPDPTPRAGWTFRWIRASTLGVEDPMNMSKQRREGWEPVRAEDHPEIPIELGMEPDRGGRFKGLVEQGGLILCKLPENMSRERQEHFNAMSRKQLESVNAQLERENNKLMPLFNQQRSRTSQSQWSE